MVLDDSFPLSQFNVTDFPIHRKNKNRHGSGIMLYARSNFPHRRRIDLGPEPIKCYGIKMMIIQKRLYKTTNWYIVVLYISLPMMSIKAINYFSDVCSALQSEFGTGSSWVTRILIWIKTTHCGIYVLCITYQISLLGLCALKVIIRLQLTYSQIARFMGPIWGPSGVDRTQVGPMLSPWTLLSGLLSSEPKRFKSTLNKWCSLNDFWCKNIPFTVCDIFDDEDGRLWSFSKLLSGVIESNAPVK